jgi:hypothetical protein
MRAESELRRTLDCPSLLQFELMRLVDHEHDDTKSPVTHYASATNGTPQWHIILHAVL